ncbi:MAG TPA: hypothetical protein VGC54_09665 [Planctomycetota bacterium]
MIHSLLLSCLLAGPFQDPAPPPAPVPELPQLPAVPQEPAPGADSDAQLMEEIQELAEKVRDGFRMVDVALKTVQESADVDAPDATTVDDGLAGAIGQADTLMADIEELLAKLPESDSQNSSSQGRQPRDQRPQDQQGRKPEPKDQQGPDSVQEQPDGAAPPPGAPTIRLFFDPRYGAWGTLPERLQATLENATTEDLPLRYRRWLDAYHRRSLEPPR